LWGLKVWGAVRSGERGYLPECNQISHWRARNLLIGVVDEDEALALYNYVQKVKVLDVFFGNLGIFLKKYF
jgi:hypothetical protein